MGRTQGEVDKVGEIMGLDEEEMMKMGAKQKKVMGPPTRRIKRDFLPATGISIT